MRQEAVSTQKPAWWQAGPAAAIFPLEAQPLLQVWWKACPSAGVNMTIGRELLSRLVSLELRRISLWRFAGF